MAKDETFWYDILEQAQAASDDYVLVHGFDAQGDPLTVRVPLSGLPSAGGFNPTGAWAAGTAYAVDDLATYQGDSYACITAHTSAQGNEPDVSADWELFLAGGTGGTSEPTATTISQTAHGLTLGTPVRLSGASYVAATSASEAAAEVAGIVTDVLTTDSFKLLTGRAFVDGLSGLTAGEVYFLQDDGSLGLTPGTINKPLLVATSATAGIWLNYRGSKPGGSGLLWRGSWTTATAYAVNDAVERGGSSYICVSAHTSDATTEPGVGASWDTVWDLMAQKGADGTGGSSGVLAGVEETTASKTASTDAVAGTLTLDIGTLGVNIVTLDLDAAVTVDLAGDAAAGNAYSLTLDVRNNTAGSLDLTMGSMVTLDDSHTDQIISVAAGKRYVIALLKHAGESEWLANVSDVYTAPTVAQPGSYDQRIAAGGDDWDVRVDNSTFSATDSALQVGTFGGSTIFESGGRFTGVSIPAGATLNPDWFIEIVKSGGGAGDVVMEIAAELALDPAAPTTYADHAGRTRTTAKVGFSYTAGANGTVYQSPDISSVIQELIDQVGWDDTARAVIIFLDNPGGSTTDSRVHAFDGDPLQAMRLSGSWS